uniref:GATA-type domain-containing protein n=1 Tax=Meloidogyne enterolobii TaxID=390850 RepID=A0A6V7X8J6_MELEN|nr:unnamed protein product [Meloidogyne enterolobii]CAD2195485.1 unnamed protein product [Meloidogyne enterolobii]
MNNNFYETSMLEESLEKVNKNELLKENIESYKNKLLSSYWAEINLIAYKIELLEKQKCRYSNKESTIISIGNKISGIIGLNKRNCFNCRVTQTKHWSNLLKEHYLCKQCGAYKHICGKFRSKELWFKSKKDDRKCSICDVTHTSQWHRYSKPGNYLCTACYKKQQRIKKSNNTKIE